MYEYVLTPKAVAQLKKLARRNPQLVAAIMRKIQWLAAHAEEIEHQPLAGTPFFSLHSASYRIPYLLDKAQQRVVIADIAQHDTAYNRVNRLK
jgi:mRNA-degrading endonuclease RelE of RelBE toxin-antitoxin system